MAQTYEEHLAYMREYGRKYRDNDGYREYMREYMKTYRQNSYSGDALRRYQREYSREWRKTHREKIKNYNRKYRSKNECRDTTSAGALDESLECC